MNWPKYVILAEVILMTAGIGWAVVGGIIDKRSDASEVDKNMSIIDRNLKVIALNISMILINAIATIIGRILK